jgi:hypothetical protein
MGCQSFLFGGIAFPAHAVHRTRIKVCFVSVRHGVTSGQTTTTTEIQMLSLHKACFPSKPMRKHTRRRHAAFSHKIGGI